MKPVPYRDMAAINLCSCVEAFIACGEIADIHIDQMMAHVAAVRASQGLPPWLPPQRLPTCNDNTSIAALDATLARISEEMA
jgi:hypothetical protein